MQEIPGHHLHHGGDPRLDSIFSRSRQRPGRRRPTTDSSLPRRQNCLTTRNAALRHFSWLLLPSRSFWLLASMPDWTRLRCVTTSIRRLLEKFSSGVPARAHQPCTWPLDRDHETVGILKGQWHRSCSTEEAMHSTFMQKVLICMVAGFSPPASSNGARSSSKAPTTPSTPAIRKTRPRVAGH